ncbi:MAG: MFS transporter, partial [Candidatus Adiutrix sp.]|nr:MFS transporter [Candidatus Adiutrix sp.]
MAKADGREGPVFFQRNLATAFCMGFTSGVPLLVVSTLVQGWLTDAGADIGSIGVMALMGLPYALKFLWAPWLDFYDPPLVGRLGRRRGWILVGQVGVIAALSALSSLRGTDLTPVGAAAFAVCFASATQDVAVDAYRREDLADEELGLGSAYYQWGYRLGMAAVSGGGLIAADLVGWPTVFRGVAALMLCGPLTLLFSPEPRVDRPSAPAGLADLYLIVARPLGDFFKRPAPWLMLLFIFFYKFGDQLAGSLNTAYFMELGYAKAVIGGLVKIFGVGATLAGVMLGGWGTLRWGLRGSLWLFGLLQMVSTLGFALLFYLPVHPLALGLVISQENLASGAGSSAFVAFMAGQTNRAFSATQYALLSALMALPRTLLASPAG